jgi:TonB family protein
MGRRLAILAAAALAASPLATAQVPAPQPGAPEEPSLAAAPVLKALVPAELPPGTAFPGPEVTVVLSIDVGPAGRVEAARVESGPGEPFDAAALAAARRFEFEPGRLSTGEAVPVTVTFRMRIQAPPPPRPPPFVLDGRLLVRGSRDPLAGVAVTATAVGPAAGEPSAAGTAEGTAAGGSGGKDRVLARATTDSEGRFRVEVEEPEFRLSATPPGHQRLDVPVQGQAGERREESFLLEGTAGENETVVSAAAIRREVMKQVVTANQVAESAGTAGDTLKAVLNLPGAARPPLFTGLPILRGSAPGDSQVFLEGQQIPILYHFGGIRSTFAPAFLESIEFVPGNFPVDYGRAQGGVIDVRTRDPRTDGFHGQGDVNFYDVGVALEGGLGGGWSIGGAFRRSWIDTFLPLVIPSDANLSFTTAPRFYDFQILTSYRPDPASRLRFAFYGSLDRLATILERPQNDPTITGAVDARIGFWNLQASYQSPVAPGLVQETSLQAGLQQIITQLGPQYFFDLSVSRLSLRSAWTWDASALLQLRGGLDFRIDGADISLNLPDSTGNNPVPPSTLPQIGARLKATLLAPAAFAELRIAPLPNLAILPGVRVDWYSDIHAWAVDPRLLVRWEPLAGTVLRAGVGLYQQPPNPAQSNTATGTPTLLPQRSLQASLGLVQALLPGLSIEVTPFYKALDRQVVSNPASNYDPSAPRFTNGGTGRVYGVETLVRAALGRFNGFLAYTYQRSLRTDPGEPERPFDFDQPSLLTAVGNYDLGRGWLAGARVRIVSGNPSTPVTGSIYDTATDVYVPVYGAKNAERLGTFFALDLRIGKTWTFRDWTLELYLDTQNVTNRGNQEGWTYSYDYAQRTPMTGLPILPILGLKGVW